jgi:hypothetical protein
VREQISDELGRLAHQRASGALEISGEPGATVFLSGGYLTYAESPGVPDLRSRLISSRRLSGARWSQVSESARAHGSIGGLLVSSAVIADSELRDLLWSITLDALTAVALPLSAAPALTAGPPLAEVRFWPRRSHLIGSHLRLDLVSVWATAGQMAERLARRQTPADARPMLTDSQRPWAVVNSEQWALAWGFDGRATIKDLAWRSGFALSDTMEWVDDLIRAGLCVMAVDADYPGAASPVPMDAARVDAARVDAARVDAARVDAARKVPREHRPPHTSGGAHVPEPMNAATSRARSVPRPADATADLPHRNPGASLAARSAKTKAPVVPQWRPADIQKSAEISVTDLLHRILKGLRRSERD